MSLNPAVRSVAVGVAAALIVVAAYSWGRGYQSVGRPGFDGAQCCGGGTCISRASWSIAERRHQCRRHWTSHRDAESVAARQLRQRH